jgi:hypothetical protein
MDRPSSISKLRQTFVERKASQIAAVKPQDIECHQRDVSRLPADQA